MKIGETDRLGRAGAAVKISEVEPVARTAGEAPRAVSDTTTILGIPEHELTAHVRAAIMQLMAEVDRLRQELKQSQARIAYLENLADQDTLLPVANRRAFVRELTRMMAFSDRYGSPGSVLYFDINEMKNINDTYGHGGGDAALVHIADMLEKNTRTSDVVGRLGGDEFAVILANADAATASEKAQQLAKAIETTPFIWQGREIKIGVSVGAHTFNSGEKAGDALDAADRAMYERKQAKGGSP
jgi:diguanylate cyclase (GGDEF)-like protein